MDKSRQVRRAELRREAWESVNKDRVWSTFKRWQRRTICHQLAHALWRKETA